MQTGEVLRALKRVLYYDPQRVVFIILAGVLTAFLEGIGITFLLPILELTQSSGSAGGLSGVAEGLRTTYRVIGLPFRLETVMLGIGAIMAARYTTSFVVDWMRVSLRFDYEFDIKNRAFERVLDGRIKYFDDRPSDEIVNTIVTQANYAGRVISEVTKFFEQLLLAAVYFGITLLIAPYIAIGAALLVGVSTLVVRSAVASGYAMGNRVADANETVQKTVQDGTQGIRDIRLFGLRDEVYGVFRQSLTTFAATAKNLNRNKSAISNFQQLLSALVVFALIYILLTFTDISLAALGVFLFAMFRLAPRISTLNDLLYSIEGNVPHLIRTEEFIRELEQNREIDQGTDPAPATVESLAFDDVTFGYDDAPVLKRVSFEVERGEFAGFVGESGAGKSTIMSLLARMYEPDDGQITVNETPLETIDKESWQSKLAVVQQDPYLFNESLRFNLTIGNRGVTESEIRRVCEIASVTEFLPDLPAGLDTQLGDDGIRLSGGQRQRVAIARALLKRADVLVLDEATSDLDSNIETKVQQAIESMDGEFIMLAIAHRLSTVENADKLYTLEGGEITEAGAHDELVTSGGKYAELYAAQN